MPEVNKTMPAEDLRHTRKGHVGLPMLPTLMASIGALVMVAVGSVFLLQWTTGRTIIQEFASRLIARNLYTSELALRHHLDAAVAQANYIAAAVVEGHYTIGDPDLEDFIAGTIAAAPQIDGLILVDRKGAALALGRGGSGVGYHLNRMDIAGDSQLTAMAEEIRTKPAAYWGDPVYRDARRKTYLSYRVPIRKADIYLGFLAVAISTEALSALTAELSDPPAKLAFMLYGRDAVLAHPLMADGAYGRSPEAPLPLLQTFGDLVIEDLPNLSRQLEAGITPPSGADARQVTVDGKGHFIFTREVSDYGELPITVGEYLLTSLVDAPIRQFYWTTVIALALFGGSLIVTALIVGAIARPVRRAARGAAALGTLDFDKVAPLSRSIFREINDLGLSFNSMLEGLRAFGRYVPRTLVTRLVKEGRVGSGSEERQLAIMFTDIAGFTSTCEAMSATEVADFINHHLALVSHCIEQEGGTIDKYIGDAVMAFWGAPNRMDNASECAARAAVAIRHAIAGDNAARAARGLDPVRVRIGIHTGPVVVGDIGAPNRINYTIVGDAVNATQRLEALGKTVDPDADTIVLISREVLEALPDGFEVVDRGTHQVKGKHDPLAVYQLVDGPV
jgi:adenylate cyclase